LNETPAQHPWAKYYSERGLARPAVADLALPGAKRRASRSKTASPASQPLEMSADLAAAVAAVTTHAVVPGTTAAPFITAMQKEAVALELKRRARRQVMKLAFGAVAGLAVLHLAITQVLYRAPSVEALQEHVHALPESILPFYSSVRQPLQAGGAAIVQADRIGGGQMRYVATVTLRLRQPLYVPAVTNGTAQYRRVQESLLRARDQELRNDLILLTDTQEVPPMPILIQRSHKAGETIVVRVPFIARRFGWQWRLATPQLALRMADRALQGDSLAHYSDTPFLIFGEAKTLADIRRRIQQANAYVVRVAKEVQKRADVVAVQFDPSLADLPAQALDPALADEPAQVLDPALADQPAQSAGDALAHAVATLEVLPDIDPDAPAVLMPAPLKLVVQSGPRSAR